jgi:hypothetical protein
MISVTFRNRSVSAGAVRTWITDVVSAAWFIRTVALVIALLLRIAHLMTQESRHCSQERCADQKGRGQCGQIC